MRVVHVVCSDQFAGVERYLSYTLPALSTRGIEVAMVGGPEPEMSALIEAGVAWQPGADVPTAVRALVGEKCDVLHAHMTSAETAAVLVSLRRRTPVVTTRHFAQRRGSSVVAKAGGRVLGRFIRREIAISDFVAGAIDGASIVVPNGVPDAPLGRHRRRTVLVAQRFEREKQTETALRAWAVSGLAESGWRLELAGRGAEEESLRSCCRSLGLGSSVDFLGFRDDLDDLMADAGILLATAPAEPFGLSVVEAMACGLPVVAAAGGAHVETVGSVAPASLFPPGDATAAADCLVRLAADDDLRRDEGQRLRARQQDAFAIGVHVDRLLRVYEDVLGR
jgi:glycosyltransferase involved in cell wall biosynthesis